MGCNIKFKFVRKDSLLLYAAQFPELYIQSFAFAAWSKMFSKRGKRSNIYKILIEKIISEWNWMLCSYIGVFQLRKLISKEDLEE